ncbi:MAG: RHS repeat-associated core domain-containing protein [Flavobacteriales bacterium]|jgi:RHS repeat-associated protein|nr:RHS repeat-associated core domain-containing protein [Flavobacteriales bacterium]
MLGGRDDGDGATTGAWTWYIFGSQRFAKITPIQEQQPDVLTRDLGRKELADHNEARFQALTSYIYDLHETQSGLEYPFAAVLIEPTPGQFLVLGSEAYAELVATDTTYIAQYRTKWTFLNSRHPIAVKRYDSKKEVLLSVEELLGEGKAEGLFGTSAIGCAKVYDDHPSLRKTSRSAGYASPSAPLPTARQVAWSPYPHRSLQKGRSRTYPGNGANGLPFYYLPPEHPIALKEVTYYLHDHLGNMRLTYSIPCVDGTQVPTLLHAADYYPYGSILRQHIHSAQEKHLTTHHERDLETGLDYRGARYYDSDVARFLSVDALADLAPSWTLYRYAFNNPISMVDPTGNYESTHTDADCNVIAVYNDGDNGVYAHANGVTKDEIDQKRAGTCDPSGQCAPSTSGGGTLMGYTAHWDEFINPETGKAMIETRIQFGATWDNIVDRMVAKAQADGMDLIDIARESGKQGIFNIKRDYPGVGAILNGQYATSRSAGNYLAGRNAAIGTIFGGSVSFDTFQKLAGAYHVKGSLTLNEKVDIVVNGTSYGPPPAYGEVMYQYRMSKAGWESYRPSK